MANGTIHREVARADRIREGQKPEQQARKNAISNLRDLPIYREEMESNSEVTVGIGDKVKVGMKGLPGRGLIVVLVILAVGAVAVAVIKALG